MGYRFSMPIIRLINHNGLNRLMCITKLFKLKFSNLVDFITAKSSKKYQPCHCCLYCLFILSFPTQANILLYCVVSYCFPFRQCHSCMPSASSFNRFGDLFIPWRFSGTIFERLVIIMIRFDVTFGLLWMFQANGSSVNMRSAVRGHPGWPRECCLQT